MLHKSEAEVITRRRACAQLALKRYILKIKKVRLLITYTEINISLSSQPPQKKMLKIKDLIYLNPIPTTQGLNQPLINRSHLRLKTLQIFASISLNASWSSGTVS